MAAETVERSTGFVEMPEEFKKRISVKNVNLKILELEVVPIDSVHPNQYNPNRQSEYEFQLLLKSMMMDGFTQPILVQKATREIVDGEHRWRAAKELGYTEAPVAWTNMTPEQMRVATLRHNRARGEENVGLTAELLRDLESIGALEFAQKELQLDDIEIQRLLNDIPAPEALAAVDFSKAWAPTQGDTEPKADCSSTTIEASNALREAEKKIAQAHTEQDRQTARREANVFRLNTIFSGEEADIVRKACGSNAATKILEWSKAELEKQGSPSAM